jgi:phenylpyruvate tautomerase PptA (4-oxalocrotonate tautomerase family)
MPMLQVYFPAGSLIDERKAALAQRLTDVLLAMEGGAKTRGGRAFATVLFTEVPKSGKFLVRVSVPEGYMNSSQKSEVHSAVNAAICDVVGDRSPNQGANVLVIIDEVPEGNWGARGQTIGLAMIADTVGLPKSSERFKWVQAYFDAKARARTAANYPLDTGGLLPPQ